MPKRLNVDYVRKYVEKYGFKLISDVYINNSGKLEMECSKGHPLSMSFEWFRNNNASCKHCNKEGIGKWTEKSLKAMIVELAKYNYELLNTEIYLERNYAENIFIRCPVGHEVPINFNSFKNSNTRCSECFGSKKYTIEFARQKFVEIGYIPLFESYKSTQTPMPCKCMLHDDSIVFVRLEHVMNGHGCRRCSYDKLKGAGNNKWKGGISPLHEFARTRIAPWIKDTFKSYDYRCAISGLDGRNNLIVHHLYNFKLILEETLLELNLALKPKINLYTDEELDSIGNKCLELHYKYGLGVVLTADLHNEFHSYYGVHNNTLEQFEEFKINKIYEISEKEVI